MTLVVTVLCLDGGLRPQGSLPGSDRPCEGLWLCLLLGALVRLGVGPRVCQVTRVPLVCVYYIMKCASWPGTQLKTVQCIHSFILFIVSFVVATHHYLLNVCYFPGNVLEKQGRYSSCPHRACCLLRGKETLNIKLYK